MISKAFTDNLLTNLRANLLMEVVKIEVQSPDLVWVWVRPCRGSESTCLIPMALTGGNQWRVQAAQINGWAALSSFIEAAANNSVRR